VGNVVPSIVSLLDIFGHTFPVAVVPHTCPKTTAMRGAGADVDSWNGTGFLKDEDIDTPTFDFDVFRE
jgi:hypothetical protein